MPHNCASVSDLWLVVKCVDPSDVFLLSNSAFHYDRTQATMRHCIAMNAWIDEQSFNCRFQSLVSAVNFLVVPEVDWCVACRRACRHLFLF